MTDLSPGQEVTVSGMGGGAAELLYVQGAYARVRMAAGNKRTVSLSRVTPKRESKALSVGPSYATRSRSDEKRRAVLRGEPLPTLDELRPVPKPVTLYSEPYLAFVSNHPCCVCGRTEGVVAHHWSHHGASTGKKVDDYRTVPLCDPCHMGEWHRTGTFPGMDREESEALMLRVQRELLTAWVGRDAGRVVDHAIVDALIRAIGGADDKG